jgi:hypothetical protein
MVSIAGQETSMSPPASEKAAEGRSLLLVAGSGRSGTSVFSGVLQRLGFHVPQPEVPVDQTNPRGFAESQWVIDFHSRLLRRSRVQAADARPAAWADVARVTVDERVRLELRSWLELQFREAEHILVKDPRLSWFLSLWHRCAEELGVASRCATMLRHPAAVVRSKQQWYSTRHTDASRAAGWLNQALFTERATRDTPRVFVRYDDLLEDWAKTVDRVSKKLELALVAEASTISMVNVAQFLDPSLSRSPASWDGLEVSTGLREQATAAWSLLERLVDEDGDAAVFASLDAARAAYVSFYEEAEAVAHSSIWAANPRRASGSRPRNAVVRAVPRRVRHRVPLPVRRALLRVLHARVSRPGDRIAPVPDTSPPSGSDSSERPPT